MAGDRGATFAVRWRDRSGAGQQAFLDSFDLQRQVSRIDAALRETPGNEPQTWLGGARVHVAQLLSLAETPDRADAFGHRVSEQFAHEILLALVPGCKHDQVGGNGLAALHLRAVTGETFDVRKLE